MGTVHCDPNTNGKQTTETIIIAEAGMSVDVTYQPRTDKHMPKKTAVSDYVAPTTTAPPTTAAPTTAAPATTGASSGESMGTMMEGVMDCTCMPNMTAMHEDMQMMESMMSASGRAIRYVKKVDNGQLRVRPMPVAKDRTQIQAAITSILSNALGRSIPANKAAKVAFRQLFSNIPNGGLLGQLAGAGTNAAEQPTNIMEDMAMNMIQQQMEQMISSGELEKGWMEMMSSMGIDPAQMEQEWANWEAQMEEEWKANGGLMGMLGMTGEDMQMMMQMMEMKAHCKCTSSDVAYGEMAMPSMPTAAGRK